MHTRKGGCRLSVSTLTTGKQGFLKCNNFRKLELVDRVLGKQTDSIGRLVRPVLLVTWFRISVSALSPSPADVLENRLGFAKHLHLSTFILWKRNQGKS